MRSIHTIIFLIFGIVVSAQNITYNINTTLNDNNCGIDSVLFENLSLGHQHTYRDIGASGLYSFDLSTATSVQNISNTDFFCRIVEIQPGKVEIVFDNEINEAILTCYDITGKLFFQRRVDDIKYEKHKIQLQHHQVFILNVQAKGKSKSFKLPGITEELHVLTTVSNKSPIKSATSNINSGIFNVGDSIRVSVYKEGYYAYPQGCMVKENDALQFSFKQKEVESTGIADTYVKLIQGDSANFELNSDENSGSFVSEDIQDLDIGSIIAIDMDNGGVLQKVVAINTVDGESTIETAPAYMEEVFVDKNFKLSTVILDPSPQLKSAKTEQEIQQALTDSAGYIHPTKIIYHTLEGPDIEKSAFAISDTSIEIINFNRDLSGINLYRNILKINEGFIEAKLNAVFEFDFENHGILHPETKIEKGDLEEFSFYFDGNFGNKIILAVDGGGDGAAENETPVPIFEIISKTFLFNVFSIPVWITFDCNVLANYSCDAMTSFHADCGYEIYDSLRIGGQYNSSTNTFNIIQKQDHQDTIHPLHIDSETEASIRAELYPRTDVKFYSFFGPYAEIVPYVGGTFSSKYLQVSTFGDEIGTERFYAWNAEVNTGLDFRAGVFLDFLFDYWDVRHNEKFPILTYNVKAPDQLALNTTLPTEADKNQEFNLRFKIADSENHGLSACQLYIDGDGEFGGKILETNSYGRVSVDWVLADTGYVSFTAKVFNPDSTVNLILTDSVYVNGRLPEVETLPIFDLVDPAIITDSSVLVKGRIVDLKDNIITERGFYLGSETRPDSTGEAYSEILDTTSFTSLITGLQSNSIYYVRAYAKCENGQSLGKEYSFKTRVDETDLIFGQQTWKKRNMNIDLGDEYCHRYWAGHEITDPNHGMLYSWRGAQKVCPEGWHIPSKAEWDTLAHFLANNGHNYDETIGGGRSKIAKAMASKSDDWTKYCESVNEEHCQWLQEHASNAYSPANKTYKNNTSGFNAYPTGVSSDGDWALYNCAVWWTSTHGTSNLSPYGGSGTITRDGMYLAAIDVSNKGLNWRFASQTMIDATEYTSDSYTVRCMKDTLLPAVSTSDVITHAGNEIMLRGMIDDPGTGEILKRGILIGEYFNYDICAWEYIEDEELDDYNGFEVIAEGLEPGTYYFRAFAENSEGVAIGGEQVLRIE